MAARPDSNAAWSRRPSVARRLTAGEPASGRMENTAAGAPDADVTRASGGLSPGGVSPGGGVGGAGGGGVTPARGRGRTGTRRGGGRRRPGGRRGRGRRRARRGLPSQRGARDHAGRTGRAAAAFRYGDRPAAGAQHQHMRGALGPRGAVGNGLAARVVEARPSAAPAGPPSSGRAALARKARRSSGGVSQSGRRSWTGPWRRRWRAGGAIPG